MISRKLLPINLTKWAAKSISFTTGQKILKYAHLNLNLRSILKCILTVGLNKMFNKFSQKFRDSDILIKKIKSFSFLDRWTQIFT